MLTSSDGDVNLGTVASTNRNGRIRVLAGGTDGSGNIIQDATRENGDVNRLFAENTINLRADGDIQIEGEVSSNWFVNLRAEGDIQVSGEVTSTPYVDLRAEGDIQIGGEVSSTGIVDLRADGDIEIEGEVSSTWSVDLRAKGDLNLTGSIATERQDVNLRAENELNLGPDALVESGNSTRLNTRFGNIGVFGSIFACLLYTSPSPRDATLSRMPSSA